MESERGGIEGDIEFFEALAQMKNLYGMRRDVHAYLKEKGLVDKGNLYHLLEE